MTGEKIRGNFVKASDTGARIVSILKVKEHYGERVDYSVELFKNTQDIKLDLPFSIDGNLMTVVENNMEFCRLWEELK